MPASRQAEAGDRRQLTVMFCDLVGSTAMAARLDPEDVQTVLAAYQQLAVDVVRNVDGHVAQFLGDGLLIYLGYPVAHEDDPARAISAGLEIVREMPRLAERLVAQVPELGIADLRVRIGIHTGPVVVGTVGAGARTEQLALGSTVNIASRLAAAAEPDTLMVSDATAGRASGLFVMENLGAQSLKGLSAPLTAFRPTAPRGTLSRIAAWRGGSGRVLVGRDDLMARLLAGWAATRAGAPRTSPMIVLRGEAGIGKTRLLQGLRQRLAQEPHGWISCHGSALQQGSAFYPAIEAVRGSLGLDGGEPPARARQLLAAALADAGIETEAAVDQLASLLGLSDGETDRSLADRDLAIDTLVTWWLRLALDKPLVVALEDLHWFDPSSLDLVTQLLKAARKAPILIVATMRPDMALPWTDTPIIDVPPLARNDIASIINQIVAGGDADAAVATLVERSDGVPLYAEELAQAFVEQLRLGGAVAGVPASLKDSIMARLDRLGAHKRLAQIGALLGRSFSHEQIAAVTGLDEGFLTPGLATIVERGILQREGVPPRATYSFRHALLQDGAADSLLRQSHREINGRIADVLAGQFATMAGENPIRVAQHFAEAGRVAEAIAWYRRAGARAQRGAAYREAEAAYRLAISLSETRSAASGDDLAIGEIYGELGHILQLTHGYAAPTTVEAMEKAGRKGCGAHDAAFLRAAREHFQATLTRAAYGAAEAQVAALTRDWQGNPGDPDLLAFRLGARIQLGFFTGNLDAVEAAYAAFQDSSWRFAATQPAGNIISAMGVAAMAAWWEGRNQLANQRIAAVLLHAETGGDPYDLAMALHYQSQLQLCQNDPEAVAATAQRLHELAVAHGFAYLAALVRGPICWSAAQLGRGSDNAAVMRATLDAMFAVGALIAGTTQLNRLAEVELIEGRRDAALATIEEALVFNPEEVLYRPASLLIRAQLRAADDQLAARADLTEALALAETRGAHGIARRIADAMARLLPKPLAARH
jgi:class 3 adenylate cyclase/tetratricopeptide (TPR) repeat protein